MAIALSKIVDGKSIRLHLHATSQSGVFRELTNLLVTNEKISDGEKFLQELHAREKVNSTYAEDGVAFPHARTQLCDEVVLAIGRSEHGVAWTGRGEVARLIFVICVPEKLITDYLVVVGAIARITKDRSLRTLLLHAETVYDFMETLLSAPSI